MRTPIVRVLHQLDNRLVKPRGLPRTVMFEAANPMLFNVFRPVYERLVRDPRIRMTLVPHGTEFTAGETFAGATGRYRIVRPRQAAWMKPDLYISTDFWSMTWLRRKTRRVHLFHGVAGKYGLDAPTELAPVVRLFDRILFPNWDRLGRYLEAGLVDEMGDVAALTGYPKADCLVDGSLDRAAIKARLKLPEGRPTILYAPTWSEHSSLNTVGTQVVSTLADAGFNVIVKLHACSYTPRGSGGVDWRVQLRAFAARPNVVVVDDPDASPCLVAADLLVTDHSTVGFEFMVLDRPLIVLHQPALIDHARINPDKVRQLQSAARVVTDCRRLVESVREELREPERLSTVRRQLARALFYGCGSATSRVMAELFQLLDLPATQPEPVVRAESVDARRPHGYQRPASGAGWGGGTIIPGVGVPGGMVGTRLFEGGLGAVVDASSGGAGTDSTGAKPGGSGRNSGVGSVGGVGAPS